jgi:hypothetical protein
MAEEPVGIEIPTKLDLVSLSPDKSTVLLHIVQAQEWDGSDGRVPEFVFGRRRVSEVFREAVRR